MLLCIAMLGLISVSPSHFCRWLYFRVFDFPNVVVNSLTTDTLYAFQFTTSWNLFRTSSINIVSTSRHISFANMMNFGLPQFHLNSRLSLPIIFAIWLFLKSCCFITEIVYLYSLSDTHIVHFWARAKMVIFQPRTGKDAYPLLFEFYFVFHLSPKVAFMGWT